MNRKKKVYGVVLIWLMLICVILLLIGLQDQRAISEDAVLVKVYERSALFEN